MGDSGMKVRFNGRIAKTGATGGCCGRKRKGKNTLVTTFSVNLPSGAYITFRKGQITEVPNGADVKYLLQHGTVEIGGETLPVFEVV